MSAVASLLQQAVARHKSGEIAAAGELYQKVVELEPRHADAWHLLGVVASAENRLEDAVQRFRRALALDPDLADAHNNLGIALKALGRKEEAVACFRTAVRLRPAMHEALSNLGNLLRDQGEFEEAIGCYDRAVRASADYFPAWYNMALSLNECGRPEEAVAAAQRAIELKPDFAPAYLAVCRGLMEQKLHRDASDYYRRALRLDPLNPEILTFLADNLERTGDIANALAVHRVLMQRDPNRLQAFARYVDLTLSVCEWRDFDGFVASVMQRTEAEMKAGKAIGVDIFNLHALGVSNPVGLRIARYKAGKIAERMAATRQKLNFTFPAPHTSATGHRRIRIGYMVPNVRKNSMPLMLKQVIERHDRSDFRVRGYTLEPDRSEFARAFCQSFDSMCDMSKMTTELAARRIRADKIDILIDTTGHTGVNCLDIAALQPAPLQAHYLGYSLTTGGDFMQYLISDRNFIPPEWQQYCSEKLVYLPHSFFAPTLIPLSPARVDRAMFDLPEHGFVFCNFNHPQKIDPASMDVWMEILRAVPDSVFWLGRWTKLTQANLIREAEARGVDGKRLVFSDLARHEVHLSRLRLADLALDNFAHGGGVSTQDALWAGLPVLSMAGDTPPSRLGLSLATAAGVRELVVRDRDSYIRAAIAWAGPQRDALRDIRARLAAGRDGAPLFDAALYTRHLEQGYRLMWRNYCAGLPPRHIDVPEASAA